MDEISELVMKINRWRLKGDFIVFTNGCFDILHAGHIHVLEEARKLGDKLIVGLNSNQSVKKIKGKDRPIIDETDRRIVLGALNCVDAVILFDEETPLKIITKLLPDILVKGGDYKKENIIGYNEITDRGGKVFTIPLIEGKSTSKIINKIKSIDK